MIVLASIAQFAHTIGSLLTSSENLQEKIENVLSENYLIFLKIDCFFVL